MSDASPKKTTPRPKGRPRKKPPVVVADEEDEEDDTFGDPEPFPPISSDRPRYNIDFSDRPGDLHGTWSVGKRLCNAAEALADSVGMPRPFIYPALVDFVLECHHQAVLHNSPAEWAERDFLASTAKITKGKKITK